jgi:hypothetical protein
MTRFRMFLFAAMFMVLSCCCSSLRAQSGTTAQRGRRITCASDDGRRHFCPVHTGGGVEMVNQRSGSPCVQGRTWGYDRRGIWVDRGCRADFVVRVGGFMPGPGPGPRQPRGMITCSSNDGGRQFCGADTRGGVRMVNQRSGSPCVQGRTWGYDRRGIWVDRGCRADFALGR